MFDFITIKKTQIVLLLIKLKSMPLEILKDSGTL
jgi:hypothetical protein